MIKSQPSQEHLLWKRKLFPELVRLAWPIAVSMLSYSVMTVVDTLFVGRLGAAALSGVAFGGVVAFTCLCFGIGMMRAVKILVSQSAGAGHRQNADEYVSAGLVIALVLGVLALLLGYAGEGLVRAWSPSAASGALAADYLRLRSWGAPAVLAAFALREASYGLGDSRRPMTASIVANLANIPLNALLIFGLGLGVQGAALATIAAQVIELAILAETARRGSIRLGPLREQRLRQLVITGWPLALEFFLDVSAFSALAALIARMGEVQLAAHQIAIQLSHFAFLPATAVAEAASVLAGQAVGAGEDRLVRRVAGRAALLNMIYVALCGALLVGFGSQLARAFTPDAPVREAATSLLHLSALLTSVFGLYAVVRAVLRGAGSERFAALVSVACAWFVTLPAAYALGVHLGWGAPGAWLGLLAEVSLGLSIVGWKLMGNSWLAGAARARERLASTAGAHSTLQPFPVGAGDLEPASVNPAV